MFLSLVELTVVKYEKKKRYLLWHKRGGGGGWVGAPFFPLNPRSDSATYDT